MAICNLDTDIRQEEGKKLYDVVKFNLYAQKNLSRVDWFQQQEFLIHDIYQPVFAEIPTFFDMAYTFNMLDFEDFYHSYL